MTDGYAMCPECGHHTSAYCGRCTVLVPWVPGAFTYCGCDCFVALGGKSLGDVFKDMWKDEEERDAGEGDVRTGP